MEVTSNATTNEVLQENHYYPFGLSYGGSHWMNDAARDNGYKYNGKELNEDWGLGWYDYGARWYMPEVGRWGAVDPLAEDYTPLNPYSYVADNPIINYDPDGEFIGTIIGGLIGGVTAAIRGENVFKGIVSGAAAGAVADLVIATGGTGLVALALAGAASGAAGNYVDQRLNGVSSEDVSWKSVGISAALGGGLGYLGGKINLGPSLGRAQGWLGRQFSRAFARKGEFEVGPLEPYNRNLHYGKTPTKSDRKFFGANSDEVVDHDPPLVQRYYEGDPKTGEPPGYKLTPQQRQKSATDRNRMRLQKEDDSMSQGGTMSKYSKQQKKKWWGS